MGIFLPLLPFPSPPLLSSTCILIPFFKIERGRHIPNFLAYLCTHKILENGRYMPTSPSQLAFKCLLNKLGGGNVPSSFLYIPMLLKKMRGVGTYLLPFYVHALIKN
jgi:hypothetical protein